MGGAVKNIFVISIDDTGRKLLVKCRWHRGMKYYSKWYTKVNVWSMLQACVCLINNFTSGRYGPKEANDEKAETGD